MVMTGAMLTALPAWGQAGDKIELSASYSYMHFSATPAVNLNGAELGGQYKIADWLGVAGDLTGEYGKVGGVSSSVYSYLVGPQVTWPRRISPFAHLLLGEAHFDGGGFASRSFAWDIGGGVDMRIHNGRFSWRIIQGDVLPTHLGSIQQHNTRVSTGIVVRF
jgi:hypothetical protein